jgi:hypothetical protein
MTPPLAIYTNVSGVTITPRRMSVRRFSVIRNPIFSFQHGNVMYVGVRIGMIYTGR